MESFWYINDTFALFVSNIDYVFTSRILYEMDSHIEEEWYTLAFFKSLNNTKNVKLYPGV